ncbi:MAG: YDG domain-containing protein [Gammaproteobacteria bacterium]
MAFASNPDFTSIGTLTARTYTISGVLGFSKELHVTAHVIAGGPGSARVVNGNQLNLGTATPIGFTPPVGTSLIGIDRTAPDGVSKARYLFRITRAAAVGTDSRLSALSLTRSGGGALTTDPGFNPDTLLYTVNEELPVGESAFKITATASVGATLRIVGRSAALASGVATSVDGLQRGSNRVQLESISETGVISVYTIIIKRASAPAPVAPRVQPDPPTTMRALHLVSFEMVNSTDTSVALVVFPNFHPGRTDYTVDWPLGAVSGNAQIRAKPNSSATNVSVRVHEFPNNDLGGGFTELSGGSYCTNLFRPSPPSCFLSPTALSAKFSIPQGGVRRIVIEVKGSRFGPGATYYTFVTRSAAPPPPVPPTPPTPPSSNAALSSLVVKDSGNNALVFDRIFDATAFSYSTVVAFSQRHVTVTAELADANASMTINGASLDSGATSGQIALQSGQANVLRLVTSAEDRLTGAVYTLTITRTGQMEDLVPTTPTTPVTPGLSADATLRSFRMVYDGFNKELIDGANFRNVNRVNETVPDQLVRVIAVPTHPAATMALSGNAVPSAGALARGAMSALLRSGSASEVILTVTAPSGATRQYIINLRHKVGDINTLSSIGVWSCERIGDSESACQPGTITSVAAVADPTFVPGATNVSAYTIVLPHGTPNNILFTARPTHQFASAAITGTLAPTPSDNGPPYAISDTMRSYPLTLLGGDTATLRVVAENGVAARNYLLTISAPARPRAMLTITPNDGLGKEFGADDPATLGFSAAFPSGDFNTIASVFSAAPFDRAPGEAVGTYDYRLNVRFRLNKFAQEYTLVLASGNVFTIRPKPLTITDSSANKVYDGNTSLPGGFAPAISGAVKKTLNGVDIDDTGPANLFVRDCVFANKNVGANKATTGCALSGPKSGNYILTANITGNISERPTTVTGSAYTTIARIYDGTTDLTSEIIPFFNPPLIQDDIVSLTGGMFADENAGSDKAITGFTLGGADIANYAVTVGAVRADIGHRALRVTASGRAENNPPSPTDRSLLVVATDRVDEGEGLLSGHTVNDVFIGALELGTRTPATGAGTQPLLQGTLTTSASPPGSNYELVEFTDGVFHYDGLPEPPQTAPGSFAATAREEKAFLSWTALDPDPTPPVLNYRLRWRIVGSGSAGWNNNGNGVAIDVDTLAYTATGLTNDREYEFEVAAVSRTGVGVHASARATPDLDETDNTLKALFSQAHMRVLPAFSKDITEYRLVGRYSVFTGLSVRATAESAHASVVVSATNQVSFVPRQDTGDDITADLNCGARDLQPRYVITVTPEAAGAVAKEYGVTCDLSIRNEALAHTLELTDSRGQLLTLDPPFNYRNDGGSGDRTMTANLRGGTLNVRAETIFPMSAFVIAKGGATLPSTIASDNLSAMSDSAIPITASGTLTIQTNAGTRGPGAYGQKKYLVTLSQANVSTDATLSGVTLLDGETDIPLATAIVDGTTAYTAYAANSTTSITLTPLATDGVYTDITVNGTAVTHGTPSGAISLVQGDNTITVVVTAEDGSTELRYTFTVHRFGPSITLRITPEAASKQYGNGDPGLLFAASGYTGGDDADSVFNNVTPFERTAGENAGDYPYQLKDPLPLTQQFKAKYTFVLVGANVFTINPRVLTAGPSTVTKVYDRNRTFGSSVVVSVGTLAGEAAGEAVELHITGGTYADFNVHSGGIISNPVFEFLSADESAIGSNYNLPIPNITGSITAKPVTVTATGASKQYDSTTAAPAGIRGSFAAGDIIVVDSRDVAAGFGTYDSKDVDATTLEVVLTGSQSGNYMPNPTIAAEITPRIVSVAAVKLIKVYDAVTAFGMSSIKSGSGAVTTGVTGETLTLTASAGVYASPDVTANVGISSPAFGLETAGGGAEVRNYMLPALASINVTGEITQKPVTAVIAGATTKVYDGTTDAPAGISGSFDSANNIVVSVDGGQVAVAFPGYDSKNVADASMITISLSGVKAGNYMLTNTTVAGSITPKAVAVAAVTLTKTYDTDTSTSGAALSGGAVDTGIAGEELTLRHTGAGAYDSADADPRTISGEVFELVAVPGNPGLTANYMLPSAAIVPAGLINPKLVAVAAVVLSKVYDSSTDFSRSVVHSGGAVTGALGSQALTLFPLEGVYGSAGVGENIPVTGAMFTLTSGARAENYALPTVITTTGIITKLATTYTLTIASRVYDATTAITTAVSGAFSPVIFSGDDVTVNTASAVYADASAGAGKAVTGAVAGGDELGNYEVTIGGGGDITARPLRVTASGNGNTAPTSTADLFDLLSVSDPATDEGLISPHTIGQVLTGAPAIGAKSGRTAPITAGTVAVQSSAPGNNYMLVFTNGTFSFFDPSLPTLLITPVAPTLSRVYGDAAPAMFAVTIALKSGDSYSGSDSSSTTFFSGNPLTVGGATDVGTYPFDVNLSVALETYNFFLVDNPPQYRITPRPVAVAAVKLTKTYDGNPAVTGATLSGGAITTGVSGEGLTLALADVTDGEYASTDVGDPVTLRDIDSADFKLVAVSPVKSGNYMLPASITASGAITRRTLTVAPVVLTKVYDGSDLFGASGIQSDTGELGNEVIGENLTLTATGGSYSSANAHTGGSINSPVFELESGDSGDTKPGNYMLPASISTTGSITAKPVTVAAAEVSKEYDGLLTAPSGVSLSFTDGAGLISGDTGTVTIVLEDNYNSKDVATAASIGVSLAGAKAGNYAVANTDARIPASITPNVVTVSAVTLTKVYDSLTLTAGATLGGGAITTGVAGESLTLSLTAGAYASADAGTGIEIEGAKFELTAEANTDLANYALPEITPTGVITAKSITTPAVSGTTKVYDGSTDSPSDITAAFAAGDRLAADNSDVRLALVFEGYNDKNVASAVTIGISLGGTAADNYALTASSVSASITKRPLRVTADTEVVADTSPAEADLRASVVADDDQGYAPGEGFAEAFSGALAYGTENADGTRPILRGSLQVTGNYRLVSFTAGLLTIGIAFDADESGVADATDGVLIARYLLGFRNAALTMGLESALRTGADGASIKAKIDAAGDKLDVDRSGGDANAADGIMIARYLLGVTEGEALVAGQADASAAEDVARRIKALLPPPE